MKAKTSGGCSWYRLNDQIILTPIVWPDEGEWAGDTEDVYLTPADLLAMLRELNAVMTATEVVASQRECAMEIAKSLAGEAK